MEPNDPAFGPVFVHNEGMTMKKSPASRTRCGNCKWFESEDLFKRSGECWVNPPLVVYDLEIMKVLAVHPTTKGHQYCDMWKIDL